MAEKIALSMGKFIAHNSVYQNYWEFTKILTPHLRRAAFLGGGAFAMPEAVIDYFPDAEVDVLEIDPSVIEVGREYFRVDDYDDNMNAIADDARRYLLLNEGTYDFIFGDAYNGIRYIPPHLASYEFFELIEERLNENGVYMMNIISSIEGENSLLFEYIHETLSGVFENVYVFARYENHLNLTQNIIIVCANHEIDFEELAQENRSNDTLSVLLSDYVPHDRYDTSHGDIITDDHNPIEYIVSKSLLTR